MDSRLRKKTVALAVSAVFLVLAVVLYSNREAVVASGVLSFAGIGPQSGQASPEEADKTERIASDGRIEGADLSAFMRDETFFDSEPDGFELLQETLGRDLSGAATDTGILTMMANSVQKDIRVQIIGQNGALVTGETFFVQMSDADTQLGSYKDVDKDGVIYIGDLSAGDYFLTLEPVDGYQVAAGNLKVTVKDQVEYKVIDDISLLIKTEDEIDASIEDTAEQDAAADADDTEDTQKKKTDGKTRFGIDVSKWNKDIDWARVKAAGVDFAIIRCGYRGSSSGVLVEDPYFVKNIKGAIANDIQVGVYFFTQATGEVEAVEEASMVMSLCREYELDYPVFIDTEGAGGNGRADQLDQETRTKVCEAFCQTIESAGYEAGVYASRNWYYNQLEAERLSPYTIWLAEYRNKPLYTGDYQLWQYTSNGSVDGILGRVDLNISYLGY